MISLRNTFCSLLLALVSCASLVAQSNTVDTPSLAQKILAAREDQMDPAVFRRLQAEASLNLAECTPVKHTVSTQIYCHFLNAVAATDEHHLYTDKMEADGYIERHGSPGGYYYLYGKEAAF